MFHCNNWNIRIETETKTILEENFDQETSNKTSNDNKNSP